MFELPTGNVAMLELVRDALREYLRAAKPGPRIGTPLLASLAVRLADGGMLEEAEKLGRALLSRKGAGAAALPALTAIADACARGGNADRAAYWRGEAAAITRALKA
jgi:hypothetical protein